MPFRMCSGRGINFDVPGRMLGRVKAEDMRSGCPIRGKGTKKTGTQYDDCVP